MMTALIWAIGINRTGGGGSSVTPFAPPRILRSYFRETFTPAVSF